MFHSLFILFLSLTYYFSLPFLHPFFTLFFFILKISSSFFYLLFYSNSSSFFLHLYLIFHLFTLLFQPFLLLFWNFPVSSIFHSFLSFNSKFLPFDLFFSTFLLHSLHNVLSSILSPSADSAHTATKAAVCVPTHLHSLVPSSLCIIYPNSTTARPEPHKGLTPQKYAWDAPGPCCQHNGSKRDHTRDRCETLRKNPG